MKYNILDEINDNLLEKAIYDETDNEFKNGKVLFSDIQNELDKHRVDNTFENAVKPLMKWMAENCHPHTKAIVESNLMENLLGKYKKEAAEIKARLKTKREYSLFDIKEGARIMLLYEVIHDIECVLAKNTPTSEEQLATPAASVAKHPLPRPLEAWKNARNMKLSDYIEWHLEQERRGNAR